MFVFSRPARQHAYALASWSKTAVVLQTATRLASTIELYVGHESLAMLAVQGEKMKRLLFGLFFVATAMAQNEPGMYLDRGADQVQMEHAQFTGTESKGGAKRMLLNPVADISVAWDFSGAEAKTKAGTSPKFIYQVRTNQTLQDFVLVRMDQKSNRRQVWVGKSGGFSGNVRTGFDPKKLVELRVTKNGTTLEIVPVQSLAPGEYFLTAGFSTLGYDFSVSK
jgi:hypothetical protein